MSIFFLKLRNYTFDPFLQTIHILVKSYGEDKVIILNSGIGTELQKNGDCGMLVSFIYSWGWNGRNITWTDIKERIKKNESFIKSGNYLLHIERILAIEHK